MSDATRNLWTATTLPTWLCRLLNIVSVLLFAGLVFLYLRKDIARPSDGWNWTDFITILLAITTVVLAALGTLIAVAAIWGYQQIQKGAETVSIAAVDRHLRSDEFNDHLNKLVEERYANYLSKKAVEEGLAKGQQQPQTPEGDWTDD